MERYEAIQRLKCLEGQDLRSLAERYGVTVFKNDKKNKGWAGQVLERFLELPLNSSRAPNFGSWELKLVSLSYKRDNSLRVKETMAITMLDPEEVKVKTFEESHLFNKLKKALIVSRIFENQDETRSLLYSITDFDLNDPVIFDCIKDDYELIKNSILQGVPLSGKMGKYIQPRTKGAGHGSTSRAFYARTQFISQILGLPTAKRRN
jgi:DNA mismatch repair protein MutH